MDTKAFTFSEGVCTLPVLTGAHNSIPVRHGTSTALERADFNTHQVGQLDTSRAQLFAEPTMNYVSAQRIDRCERAALVGWSNLNARPSLGPRLFTFFHRVEIQEH